MKSIIFDKNDRIVGVTDSPISKEEYAKLNLHIKAVSEYLKSCVNDEDKLNKLFNEARFPADWEYTTDGNIMVEINWGDWKHEHLFCNDLMNAAGFYLISEEVTEEDGSDCYSAIRIYGKGDNK